MGVYVIKAGDTGADIAKAQGLTLPQLFNANPGVNWESLPVGYHIHVPGNKTTQYTIAPGDSGRAIAGRLGITFDVLENLNPGTKWTALEPGKSLTVPASDTPSLLKACTGAPISGVPARMPPPTTSQGTVMLDATRKKVTDLLGGSEDAAALNKVKFLDWVGCFALILDYAATQTQPAGGPDFAIVDLRDPNNANDKDVVPWKIPASLPMPCTEGKPNAKVFDDATKGRELAVLFSGWKQLREVIFVDTHGHVRAPEIATRYAQWITKTNTGKAPGPKIFVMTGGLAAYCNAQCFGRVLVNAPNAFVTGWPKNE